jgi:hypothetical protein
MGLSSLDLVSPWADPVLELVHQRLFRRAPMSLNALIYSHGCPSRSRWSMDPLFRGSPWADRVGSRGGTLVIVPTSIVNEHIDFSRLRLRCRLGCLALIQYPLWVRWLLRLTLVVERIGQLQSLLPSSPSTSTMQPPPST